MICLFEKDAVSFEGNGICVLNPSVCTVTETAGGWYALHMEHPMDEAGKFLMLTEERIIRAPVPPVHVQSFTLPDVTVYVTNKDTYLYSVLPAYRRVPGPYKAIKQNPSAYAWKQYITYRKGEFAVSSGKIYQAAQDNRGYLPGGSGSTGVWTYKDTVEGDGDTWQMDGGTHTDLADDTNVTKIADYNATFIKVRTLTGSVGYVPVADVDETQTTTSGMTVDAFDITEQPFRIYKISGEDDTQMITVEALHISYDFKGNALYSCKITEADPMTAISILRGALLDDDERLIVCDIGDKTVSEDWSFYNPIVALLDPDEGLVPALGARLVRNNADFYILDNSSPRKGITLAYGVNLTGVSWSRNIENVVTRVLPRCGDGEDGYLFLDEVYVESEHSTDYRVQRTEMMDCSFSVGDTYEKADGTEITLTESSAKDLMKEKAKERFDVDRADAVEVELNVTFVLLGDTEEYRQYRGLQTVCLYDEITVRMEKSGLIATAQVARYEFDSILKRYNSIRVGEIKSLKKRIPGYRLKAGSITYEKLGSSLISKIKSANAEST